MVKIRYRRIEKSLKPYQSTLTAVCANKKTVNNGIEVEVSSLVSCLSNRDYNKKHGTQLEDVPQIARWKLYADDLPPEVVEDIENKKRKSGRLESAITCSYTPMSTKQP
jgi:hypothetical protein